MSVLCEVLMIEKTPEYIIEALSRGVNRFNFDPLYSDLEGWATVKNHLEMEIVSLTSEIISRKKSIMLAKTNKQQIIAKAMYGVTDSRLKCFKRAKVNIQNFLSDEYIVTWELL
ncbi:hypothetical protein NVP2275O_453 [Vibrio phage 2.275.O._10N.286.54.E11]|nr:hypothetical protein NVP2275O_453 [Vibrio phage 2.275.O._10N.286.54.E11]